VNEPLLNELTSPAPDVSSLTLDLNTNRRLDAVEGNLPFGPTLGIDPTNLPVGLVGDFNGDNRTDFGAYNPNTGTWFIDLNGNRILEASEANISFGGTNRLPVVGNWDGIGGDNIGVFNPIAGTWSLDLDGDLQVGSGESGIAFGLTGITIRPVIADWNGDGRDDLGWLT
jgi:hypothetical protein